MADLSASFFALASNSARSIRLNSGAGDVEEEKEEEAIAAAKENFAGVLADLADGGGNVGGGDGDGDWDTTLRGVLAVTGGLLTSGVVAGVSSFLPFLTFFSSTHAASLHVLPPQTSHFTTTPTPLACPALPVAPCLRRFFLAILTS